MASIYIYSPSGATRDKKAFRQGLAHLKAAGHELVLDPAVLTSHQRFAGSDEERLAAISRAAQSGADVALIARGGYGLSRLLPHINYEEIARSVANGTQWMGFSDFTALQLALLATEGAPSWAGLAVGDDVACVNREDKVPDDVTLACFDDVVSGVAEGAGWRMAAAQATACGAVSIDKATLWGGNLSVLVSLLGTPYCPNWQKSKNGVKGGVLFLEDVGEHPYRIERMFTQLLHAGVFDSQAAVVLGAFSNYKLTAHDKGYSLKSAVQWLRGQTRTLIVEGLPFGHIATKVCLPVGQRVSLRVDGRDAFILW